MHQNSHAPSIHPEIAPIREQLVERRNRLAAIPDLRHRRDYRTLLLEVDSALERLDAGSWGSCERCHEAIEPRRLSVDPLTRVCLDCLAPSQQRALEQDLELASTVQHALLPPRRVEVRGWRIEHRYRPLGPVSGDYCDVLGTDERASATHIVIGDVSGKGVSASILMAHLQAVFRSLAPLDLTVADVVERANRIFCEGILANSFSTLLFGRLWPDGTLELCNAGHCLPLLVREGDTTPLDAANLPLGMFRECRFRATRYRLAKNEALVLYTDGLCEATDDAGESYGIRRVEEFARRLNGERDGAMLDQFLSEWEAFHGKAAKQDDLTVMIVRRTE